MDQTTKLTTLQECINQVQYLGDHPEQTQNEVVTFRVHKDVKGIAEDILRNHNITLSAYLRKCMESLVRDYRDPKSV